MPKTKQTARLDEWDFFGGLLYGKVYGHPGFKDGEEVRTSPVVSPPDSVKEGNEVETKNTIYTLGSKGQKASTTNG